MKDVDIVGSLEAKKYQKSAPNVKARTGINLENLERNKAVSNYNHGYNTYV